MKMAIQNEQIQGFEFLADLVRQDHYFPRHLVSKGQQILMHLCETIELQSPRTLADLYALTHQATERFNELAEEFWDSGSEIETGARENICADMVSIATAYGFAADPEQLTAPRDW